MLRFGASLRLPAFNPRFFGLAKHLRLQRRPYAKVGGKSNAKSESLVRRPAKKDIDPDAVWVDPFNQDEKHEAEDEDSMSGTEIHFPPFPVFPSTRPDNLLCDLLYLAR